MKPKIMGRKPADGSVRFRKPVSCQQRTVKRILVELLSSPAAAGRSSRPVTRAWI